MKYLYILIFIVFSTSTYAQSDFIPPMGHQRVLAGSFGELRSNHFHSGIDFKTQGMIGKSIYAPAEGYVSRASVSIGGYGQALYIVHPNGYTTVYGHISSFSPRIDSLIRVEQYAKESFVVNVEFPEGAIKVFQGELLAYSGNTGSSEGPHLHFEVRRSDTNTAVDPLSFAEFSVKDTKVPTIRNIYVMPIDTTLSVHTYNYTYPIVNTPNAQVAAIGATAILVDTYDTMDDAPNKNGIHSIEMFVDEVKAFGCTIGEISFDNTRDINHHIYYPHYLRTGDRLVKCYIDQHNTLMLYHQSLSKPIINVEQDHKYNIRIVVSDRAGNTSIRKFTLVGDKNKTKPLDNTPKSKSILRFDASQENRIMFDTFKAIFPKGVLYQDLYVDFTASPNGIFTLKNPSYALLNGSFTVSIDVSKYPLELQQKMQITRPYVAKDGRITHSFMGGKLQDGVLTLKTSSFGAFGVTQDNTKPSINPIAWEAGQKIPSKILKFKISDRQSGIRSFAVYIDDKWTLAQYEYKTGELSVNTSKECIPSGTHSIRAVLLDNVGNQAVFDSKFTN